MLGGWVNCGPKNTSPPNWYQVLHEELVLSENSGYVTAFNMLVALPQDKIMDNVQTN